MIADFLSTSSINGWDVLIAIIVAVAGWIAASLAKRAVLRLLERVRGITPATSMVIARVVRYTLLLLTIGVVLTVLGAPLQPLLAAVILIAAVMVIALRGIAANFGAGLVIQTRHVVNVGDEIEVLEFLGTVTELNGRCVIIASSDGRVVRIPNSTVLENPLVNLTEQGVYRSELEVRVQGDRQLSDLAEQVAGALDGIEKIHDAPEPQTLMVASTPQATTLRVRFWHDPVHRSQVRSDAVSAIAGALAAAGVPAVVDWRIPKPPRTPPLEF
ncbi:MAG TPA: mechanosensitive ion channel family protein [Galbitalea sp.]|jgi:small-conductance mechanosensitive channel